MEVIVIIIAILVSLVFCFFTGLFVIGLSGIGKNIKTNSALIISSIVAGIVAIMFFGTALKGCRSSENEQIYIKE
ncbi:hypothetical protein [Mucilaginibacter sp.]